MITDVSEYVRTYKPDQCQTGLAIMAQLVQDLNPKIYMEIGCARLVTFYLFHERLPKDGLCIGVDAFRYDQWDTYPPFKGSEPLSPYTLFPDGSANPEVIAAIKSLLGDRKIDCLFIDGDHEYPAVRADWDNYSPMVRSGGLVFFHDWDPPAVAAGDLGGQGAAMVCNELQVAGYSIQHISPTSIGTAYIRMP